MLAHARLSPSASSRWLACPGSIRLSEGVTETTSSPSAVHGTEEHRRAADALNGADEPVSADIQLYVEEVRHHMQQRGAVSFVEQRVHLTDDLYGTADALVIHRDTLHVFDLKTGHAPVLVAGNTQLMIYAAAALNTYPALMRRVKRIALTIVQPRVAGITRAQLTVKQLRSQIAGILLGAERTRAADAPLCAGDHCRFCPAAAGCSVRKNEALQLARTAFAEMRDGVPDAVKIFAHEYGPRITDWLEAVKATSLINPPHGYKVIDGRGRRVWREDIGVPHINKPMTLAEATTAGHNIDALTEYKPGGKKLIRVDNAVVDGFTILTNAE